MAAAALSLAGRTAAITGGSRGIGLAVAQRLAREGATCTLVGRDADTLRRALAGLLPPSSSSPPPPPPPPGSPRHDHDEQQQTAGEERRHEHEHAYLAGDVRDPDMWEALMSGSSSSPLKTKPDILINAAGTSQSSLLATLPDAALADLVAVNLTGTALGCKYAMRAWVRERAAAARRGASPGGLRQQQHQQQTANCIVNVASLLAVRGGHGAAVYAASKAGVAALTRAVASEGASRGIRANVVLPGYIETDMTSDLRADERSSLTRKIPAGRFGTPDEVADAVLFLVCNEYANNCVLNLDGGLSAVP